CVTASRRARSGRWSIGATISPRSPTPSATSAKATPGERSSSPSRRHNQGGVWRLIGFAALVGIALAAATRPAPAAREPVEQSPPSPPRVTLISDSVAEALLWHPDARDYLGDGLDLRIQGWACRRLVVPGCFAYGGNAPSTLETIRTLGAELGPVAVIDVGYS